MNKTWQPSVSFYCFCTSANHEAAAQCKNPADAGQELRVLFTSNLKKREKNMISVTLIMAWMLVPKGNFTHKSLEFTQNSAKYIN